MSNRDRHTDEPVDTADLRLVEALYGESDAEDAEVDGELLEGFRELRSMFSDLPEEDPPAAITAKLMSAAAEAAKEHAPEKKGLWSRLLALFEPIGAHPALAAAASLMLVVTVGGVLMLTGRSKVAEPEVSAPETPASIATADESPTAKSDDGFGERADGTTVGATLADPNAPPPPSPSQSEPTSEGRTETPKREAKDDAKRRLGGERLNKSKPRPTRSRTTVKEGGKGKGQTGLDFSGNALDDVAEPEETDLDQAPEPEPTPGDLPTMQRQQPSKSAAEVESLTSKGRKAASKGDCGTVVKLGQRVRSLDAEHYRDVYRRDAAINRCYTRQKKRPATRK